MNGKVRGNPKNTTVKILLVINIISLVIDITCLFLICIDFTGKYKIKTRSK